MASIQVDVVKTMSFKGSCEALDRPDFYFNLGFTKTRRATLIGNTHFDKQKGTFFSESFCYGNQNSKRAILLDELSRYHPDVEHLNDCS